MVICIISISLSIIIIIIITPAVPASVLTILFRIASAAY